mmetsp:Transcript_21545/g.32164  ORF Transcript_21545/g.32164 Transcript_21545/m.32164 type:complete len:292 (+) Transcript_21545:168-1043(+)
MSNTTSVASSTKTIPLNDDTMSVALSLLNKVDDEGGQSSYDSLLRLHRQCKASSAAAIASALLPDHPGNIASRIGQIPGTSKFKGMQPPMKRVSMLNNVKKGMNSKKQMDQMGGGASSNKAPQGRKFTTKPLPGKAPPPSAMNFLAALNSNKAVTRTKSAPVTNTSSAAGRKSTPSSSERKDKISNKSSSKSNKQNLLSPRKSQKRRASDTTSTSSGSSVSTPRPTRRSRREAEKESSPTSESENSVSEFLVGDDVVVLSKEEGHHYPAIIKLVEPGGTYEVSIPIFKTAQ